MKSIQTIYRIGPGPSSSHTLAVQNACLAFKNYYPNIKSIHATLVGSLALTGKGHYTDAIIQHVFQPLECNVDFELKWDQSYPHGFSLQAQLEDNTFVVWHVFSIGGGAFEVVEQPNLIEKDIYSVKNLTEINQLLSESNKSYYDYILSVEPNLNELLKPSLKAMLESVEHGLNTSGKLRGTLNVNRCGQALYQKALGLTDVGEQRHLKLMSYAFATAEENACGHIVVTAPTLGSCGVMAALMYYCANDLHFDEATLLKGLAVGGLFGNIARFNATVSGAVGGCQAEIGVACAMAAAAYNAMLDCNNAQIETAAEIAMEHHLGLTCDPIEGYVIIPCIERNSQAVLRALDAALLARHVCDIRDNKVSFDAVVDTMKYTGSKLCKELKETSLGGLAKIVKCDRESEFSYD